MDVTEEEAVVEVGDEAQEDPQPQQAAADGGDASATAAALHNPDDDDEPIAVVEEDAAPPVGVDAETVADAKEQPAGTEASSADDPTPVGRMCKIH